MLATSMSNKNFGFGTQIRKSPYFDSTVKWGATGFSVYNHMYIPRDFGSPEQNFWNLIEKAILCDVAVERQVEITGPDAFKFTQTTNTSRSFKTFSRSMQICINY
jgi:glycine cleavage system aminomethyltransferase T